MLIGSILSCDNNDESEIENQTNKVVLLKVDFLTNIFEGGKELEFSPSSSFTISSTYLSPGDFGNIQFINVKAGYMNKFGGFYFTCFNILFCFNAFNPIK